VKLFFIPEKGQIATIDSDFMCRLWSLSSGKIQQTIIFKNVSKGKSKLDIAELGDYYNVAICDEEGNVTVNNLYSGSILFRISSRAT